MLAGILFLTLVLVVAVLVTVDVLRTPSEAPSGPTERHAHDTERVLTGARGGSGVHAFSREPAPRENPASPAPAPAAPAAAARTEASPAEAHASFDRADQTTRAFDQMRREMAASTVNDAALRGKLNAAFVNLSRRSQALVERQLRLIETLEHGERDQQRLTSLSRLNRIAMRIHRTSQNLLILAGNEPATNWNQPVTLAHLVEAARSEVEDFERVSFEVQPDIAVRGPVVHDLVHLLVELVDNATSFSAADMPVYIKGHILTSGGALVDITDRGIGMVANEMAYANQQLDNPPTPDIDVPKWMGLLVVGRLAARHGIRVRLNPAELGGLTALVWLPDEVLTHSGIPADPGYAATGSRGATASSAGLASARMPAWEALAPRPDPAWSARGTQTMVQAEPPAAVRLSDSGLVGSGLVGSGLADAPGGDVGVVVPQADGRTRARGLPIFDEVESHWSRGSHEAPGPAGPTAAGLPRRPPPPAQDSRTAPRPPSGTPNLPGLQRRASPGWPAPAEEPNPDGPDES
jgi:signal transduction histidine kinase